MLVKKSDFKGHKATLNIRIMWTITIEDSLKTVAFYLLYTITGKH